MALGRIRGILIAAALAAPLGAAWGQDAPVWPTDREVQTRLDALGYAVGTIDGVLGKRSRGALRKYQTSHGLAPTGLIDDQTRASLFPEWQPSPPSHGGVAAAGTPPHTASDTRLPIQPAANGTTVSPATAGDAQAKLEGEAPAQEPPAPALPANNTSPATEGEAPTPGAANSAPSSVPTVTGTALPASAPVQEAARPLAAGRAATSRLATGASQLPAPMAAGTERMPAVAAREAKLPILDPEAAPEGEVSDQAVQASPVSEHPAAQSFLSPPELAREVVAQLRRQLTAAAGTIPPNAPILFIIAFVLIVSAFVPRYRAPRRRAPAPAVGAAATIVTTVQEARPGGDGERHAIPAPPIISTLSDAHQTLSADTASAGTTVVDRMREGGPPIPPPVSNPPNVLPLLPPAGATETPPAMSASQSALPAQAPLPPTSNNELAPATQLLDVARPPESAPPAPAATRVPSAIPRLSPAPEAFAEGRWLSAGTPVTIRGHAIAGGLIYVGTRLRVQAGSDDEHCLINPTLPVAGHADVTGQYMDYWPSYDRMAPSSRTAYLQWLASDRANPQAYIGYVFLYFYGLERRLLLERAASDRAAILGEVERLLTIYGGHQSFRRYATELIAAAGIAFSDPGASLKLDYEPASGAIPLPVRLALGRCAQRKEPISPDLFLAYVMSHPETRVRMPARRAFDLLRESFIAEVSAAYPSGLRFGPSGPLPGVELTYRAASSSFEVQLRPSTGRIPDVTGLAEPIGVGRALLDKCTEELDAYSRTLARGGGAPTLHAISRLPPALRQRASAELPGNPLTQLLAISAKGAVADTIAVQQLLGLPRPESGKALLRDMAAALSSFGIGMVPDPRFSPRIPKAVDKIVLFNQRGPDPARQPASEHYRLAYLTVALALIVALADGTISAAEEAAIQRLIDERQDLTPNEAFRLQADIVWLRSNPVTLAEMKAQLRELPEAQRSALSVAVAGIATADGQVESAEVTLLERMFRQMDVPKAVLYGQLQQRYEADAAAIDAEVPEIVAPGAAAGTPIPPPTATKPALGLDTARLARIRQETHRAATILSEVFADDDASEAAEASPPSVPPEETSANGDGLNNRFRNLIREVTERESWSQPEFAHLVGALGFMPGAAQEMLNAWALDTHDDMLLEEDGPVLIVNRALALQGA